MDPATDETFQIFAMPLRNDLLFSWYRLELPFPCASQEMGTKRAGSLVGLGVLVLEIRAFFHLVPPSNIPKVG
jgi:hypothetical protein